MKTRNAICLLLILVLITAFSLPALAETGAPKVIDEAGLLTERERTALENKCAGLSSTYQMDVVILTNYSLNGKSSEAFADDYFDYNGYGTGGKSSGILLLVSMEERDWAISTRGDAIQAVTDYGLDRLEDAMLSGLSGGDYYGAFDAYLEELEYLFREYAKGTPVDVPSRHAGASGITAGKALLCVAAAAAIGGLVTFAMRRQMNTAVPQNQANAYMKKDSFHLTTSRDIFLYSTMSKTRRQQNNNSGGGGSSIHISSSGASHGGSHGKF